jgi:hypothetical protein
VMAMSVNRRIERTLPNVMGQRDPEAMIRVRSTDPIRASGLVPRAKAAHMTASDCTCRNAKKTLANRGPSTHDGESVAQQLSLQPVCSPLSSSPGSYGGLIVKCVLHGVKSYIEMIVRCACRRVHHPGRSPGSDRSVCKLVSGGTWLFRTMVPHSRGRGDLGDGTNLDRGISQP